MNTIGFFDTKPYDEFWFNKLNTQYKITYFEERLNHHTAKFTDGFDAVCAFVNDDINAKAINRLCDNGVKIIALRCAGFSNVDMDAAKGRIKVVRVPSYSPHAVAEHAMGMLLSVNRRLYKAYNRTREFNFNISGLEGVDLYGKTAGIIGTGKIGKAFAEICRGFGMRVIGYDAYPDNSSWIEYVSLDKLFSESDVISLHCPLTDSSYHLLNAGSFSKMKNGVFIVNTSRGALLDGRALLEAVDSGKIRGAALDVYEEEAGLFYEDNSTKIIRDSILSLLMTKPNVLITSHQAFLTEEALHNIAEITLHNLDCFFAENRLENEVKA